MIFRQLFDAETWTYTYLIADAATGEAALIDPVRSQVQRDMMLLQELGLTLKYTLDTHVHADHITGTGELRKRLKSKAVLSRRTGSDCADILVDHGETLNLGTSVLEVLSTPGHTNGCLSVVSRDGDIVRAFTGDALLIRGCGRTDFQQGSANALFHSVRDQLFALPDHTQVYPGHDYKGRTSSTIGEEKAHNPRLNTDIDEATFVHIMDNLGLAAPRLVDVAVPANMACGHAA